MAVTSIPKSRLIKLIVDDLDAQHQATSHFNINISPLTEDHLMDRLMSFTKDELLTFIATLGQEAENALHKLETNFPLRRSPTLYIAYIDSRPIIRDIIPACRSLSKQGREGGIYFESKSTIRFIYLPQLAIRTMKVKGVSLAEF
jgi:hypothetical protein